MISIYIDKSIREYINVVQSGDPTPGGGSVCALVTSLGAALTLMTSNFSIGEKYFEELDKGIQEDVKQTHKEINKSIEKLNEFIDEDAKGFATVINAYNEKDKPKNEEEKQKIIQESYKKALATPLNCSIECLKLLKLQQNIVEYGNKDTITDVGVGVILVYAALEGSIMSVRINLNYIEDKDYKTKIQVQIDKIYKEARILRKTLVEDVDKILDDKSFNI